MTAVALGDGCEICATMALPISSEAVAPGDGALQTWSALCPRTMRKSSTRLPSLSSAWARTPASHGTRSDGLNLRDELLKTVHKGGFAYGAINLLHPFTEILAGKSPETAVRAWFRKSRAD